MRRSRSFALIACLLAILPIRALAEPLVVVVSSDWPDAETVDLADLRAVYLGRRSVLFGRRVHRVDLPAGGPSRAGFSRSVLGRPEAALERYWIEQALLGGALPPRQVGSAAEVVDAVRRRVGTIGYLRASDLADDATGVRVLAVRVGGRSTRAGDPDYPVHALDATASPP